MRSSPVDRPRKLVTAAGVLALLLAACGNPGTVGNTSPTTTPPASTTTLAADTTTTTVQSALEIDPLCAEVADQQFADQHWLVASAAPATLQELAALPDPSRPIPALGEYAERMAETFELLETPPEDLTPEQQLGEPTLPQDAASSCAALEQSVITGIQSIIDTNSWESDEYRD